MSNKAEDSTMDIIERISKTRPVVSTPKKHLNDRKGRGFSLKEIKAAAIPLDDAKHLSIPIDFRRKSLHQANVQMLSAFYREIVVTQKEERTSLDLSKKEAFKDLKQLRGIKGGEAKLLLEAGIKSLQNLTEEEPRTLAKDTGINEEKIQSWITQAKTLLKRKSIETSIEDLMRIKGMNRAYTKRLIDFGILSVTDLSSENAEILAKDLRMSEKILTILIEQAMEMTGKAIPKPKKAPKEKKVEEKPSKTAIKALELKDLDGIGKGDLKALKDLGITKIEQLIEEDIDEITSISGINKANLQRWVGSIRDYLGLPPAPITAVAKEEAPDTKSAVTNDLLSELLKIEGVGKKTAEKLIEAGLQSIQELKDSDPKELSKKSKVPEKTIIKIIENLK
ncbi:MAG: DUF4332 domain-containing protein [Promethearchaeota archaeon]|nr:MAG: DUF4332 domain-containing protein [Candidatus Lokiarchaeota archaeon]